MTTEQLSFKELLAKGNGQLWKLQKIIRIYHKDSAAMMGGDYGYDWTLELANAIGPILCVMDLLRITPNACVNREALDAFQDPMDKAAVLLAEPWAIEKVNADESDPEELAF